MILSKMAWTMGPWSSRKTIHPITLLFLEPNLTLSVLLCLTALWVWVVQTLLFLRRGAPTEAKCLDAACAWGLLQSLAWPYSQAGPNLPSQPCGQLPHLYWWACTFHILSPEHFEPCFVLFSYHGSTPFNYFVAVLKVGFEGLYILSVTFVDGRVKCEVDRWPCLTIKHQLIRNKPT